MVLRDRAGLRGTSRDRRGRISFGDRIVAIEGQEIATFDDLYNVLDGRAIGSEVQVDYYRGRSRKNAKMPLIDLEDRP